MKKIVFIICLCLILPIIYLILRTGINLNNTFGLEGQFQQADFVRLLSNNLAEFLGSIMWLITLLYIIVFCINTGTLEEIFKNLYKPRTQAVVFAITAIFSFILFFIQISSIELVLILSVVPLTLIITTIVINIVRLIKTKKAIHNNMENIST